jgi:hypothetical protein
MVHHRCGSLHPMVLGAVFAACSAAACHPKEHPPPACEADVPCADIRLRPGPSAPTLTHGFAAGKTPTVAMDLLGLPGVDVSEFRVEPCDARPLVYRQVQPGSQSYLVPAEWLQAALARVGEEAGCIRLTAVSYSLDCGKAKKGKKPKKNEPSEGCARLPLPDGAPADFVLLGRVVGSVTTQVLRGDRSVTVRALRPAGEVAREGTTRFAILVGGLSFSAEEPYTTAHTFAHLPDGVVTRARVTTPLGTAGQWAVGDLAPLVRVDATAPTATIDVLATEPVLVGDRFESDGSSVELSRAPLAVGGSEDHTGHVPGDIDNIPLALPGAGTYRVALTPLGKRPGDFALELRNPAGAIVGGSNRTLSEINASPTATVVASGAGTWLATVRRNDREPVAFAYTLALTTEVLP